MKLPYFKLKDAFEDVKDSFSYGGSTEKIGSTARLIGKTIANAGMLAAEAAVEVGKELSKPETMARILSDGLNKNRNNMSGENIEKVEQRIEHLKEMARAKKLEKDNY